MPENKAIARNAGTKFIMKLTTLSTTVGSPLTISTRGCMGCVVLLLLEELLALLLVLLLPRLDVLLLTLLVLLLLLLTRRLVELLELDCNVLLA